MKPTVLGLILMVVLGFRVYRVETYGFRLNSHGCSRSTSPVTATRAVRRSTDEPKVAC